MSKQYGFKIDDFIVFYEYYKLKANPKKQVVDELRDIIAKSDVYELVDELHSFSNSLKKVFESTSPEVLSLRYIPWRAYVMTALTSAYAVNYPKKEELFRLIRRFFYLSLISGCTLNQIKQTSFKMIESIVNENSIEDIKEDLSKLIISRRMIAKTYDALENYVYNEKFLKPLMLSLEYENREETNTNFYSLDGKLHMDHILPRAYSQKDEWNYINDENAENIINGIGNMALLQDIKNEEALNCGFDEKIRIYKGLDENGNNKSGITSFEYTRKIIEAYDKGNTKWDIEQINDRKEFLIKEIEKMLEISKEEIHVKIPEGIKRKNGKSKWLYKEVYYDNVKLVRALISDFVKDNNYKIYEEIPKEIRNFKMYSHELILLENHDWIKKNYSYSKISVNNMELYIRSICKKDNTNQFIEVLRKHYNFELKTVIEN